MNIQDNITENVPATIPPDRLPGRPSGYDKDYHPNIAKKFCLLGAKDSQLAEYFEISEATLNNWRNAHPELLEAIKSGREWADMNVANSLYNRAVGGDLGACVFWLKNRQKEHWRDKQDIVISGNVSITALSEQDLDAELQAIRARLDNIIDITPEEGK